MIQANQRWKKLARTRLGMATVLMTALVVAAAVVSTSGAFPALAGALPAKATAAVTGSDNPYSPAHLHPYRHGAVPTREAQAQMAAYRAQHPRPASGATTSASTTSASTTSAANLRYKGGTNGIGVTTGPEQVYLVFWGYWGPASTNAQGDLVFTGPFASGDPYQGAPALQELFKGLGTHGETWSGVMTQYCEGVPAGTQTCPVSAPHVAYPSGGALAGVWYDDAVIGLSPTAHQLAVEAVAAANHFGNTTPSANRNTQYIILTPQGVSPDGWNAAVPGWCAWHSRSGDAALTGGGAAPSTVGDVAFTTLPYVMNAGVRCGMGLFVSPDPNFSSDIEGYTIFASHEYAETITDPLLSGWDDGTIEGENADKCHDPYNNQPVTLDTGTFLMTETWSNDTPNATGGLGACVHAHPIVTSPSPLQLNPPADIVTSIGVARSLTFSASGGIAPYIWIFNGLPAGMSYNYLTGVVSGTPSVAGVYTVSPFVTDSGGSRGSLYADQTQFVGGSFTWTVNKAFFSGFGGGSTPSGAIAVAISRARQKASSAGYPSCSVASSSALFVDPGVYTASATVSCPA